jgi:predicted nucleic acid-binding Zn ribbon protein
MKTPPTRPARPCRVCARPVPVTRRRGRPSTFCSEDCRRSAERAADRVRRGPSKYRSDGLCPRCGVSPRAVSTAGRVRGWCKPCEAADKAHRRANDPEWRQRANESVREYRVRLNARARGEQAA